MSVTVIEGTPGENTGENVGEVAVEVAEAVAEAITDSVTEIVETIQENNTAAETQTEENQVWQILTEIRAEQIAQREMLHNLESLQVAEVLAEIETETETETDYVEVQNDAPQTETIPETQPEPKTTWNPLRLIF